VAALTTLFNYQFGKNTKEQKLLLDYLKSLPKKRQNKITEFGLSLFELKEIGEYFGFQVYVVKIPFMSKIFRFFSFLLTRNRAVVPFHKFIKSLGRIERLPREGIRTIGL
jgi:hypothetical protein